MADDPYLLDVHTVALAHGVAPYSERALRYVDGAIEDELTVAVPVQTLIGGQHTLYSYYNLSWEEAGRRMRQFGQLNSVEWLSPFSVSLVSKALQLSADENVSGWDGYYATLCRQGNYTIVTTDEDFEDIEQLSVERVLTEEQANEMREWFDEIRGTNRDDEELDSRGQTDGGDVVYDPVAGNEPRK